MMFCLKKRFSIEKNFEDVIKSSDSAAKPMNVGQWWEGARVPL